MNYRQLNGKPAIKLHTVSVIEFENDVLDVVRSFADNPEGNKRAEKLFVRLLRAREVTESKERHYTAQRPRYDDESIQDFLDDGFYESDNGTYRLFLTHSI